MSSDTNINEMIDDLVERARKQFCAADFWIIL